jgi:hypothetical protein
MKPILLLLLLPFNFLANSQKPKSPGIELSFQPRYDKQAAYTTRFGNVSYQNVLQLFGTSIRAGFSYKKPLKNSWFLKPFAGYYRFDIDKITNNRIPASQNDPSKFRPINYLPDSLPRGYSTKSYHYNTFAFGLAIGKDFYLDKNYTIIADFDFTYLFTYSQHYETGKGYTTNVSKGFGYLIDSRIGIKRDFRKIYLASAFVLPIYKEWKKDAVFLENPNENLHNLFGGYGLLLAIGKYLH